MPSSSGTAVFSLQLPHLQSSCVDSNLRSHLCVLVSRCMEAYPVDPSQRYRPWRQNNVSLARRSSDSSTRVISIPPGKKWYWRSVTLPHLPLDDTRKSGTLTSKRQAWKRRTMVNIFNRRRQPPTVLRCIPLYRHQSALVRTSIGMYSYRSSELQGT